ncbi:copper resistance CopC family protein [Halomonas sp. H5]|uniref:copper resistance CopC family protein n=1 Tax=Halomonas sp. H5 TaxID=3423910 RepID=UPI003D360EDA
MRWILVPLLCLLAAPLWGHTRLVDSVPAPGDPLIGATLELGFSEAVQPRFSDFVLLHEAQQWRLEPRLDDARRRVTLPLPEGLSAGTYVLDWQVLAEDGHTTAGRLEFEILP